MCKYVSTTDEHINTIKLKGEMKKQDIKGSFFKIQTIFYLSVFHKQQVSDLQLLLNILYQSFIAIELKTVEVTTFQRLESVL